MYGLVRSPDNSLLVVCGGEVVVVDACNATTTDDISVASGVVAVDGVVVGAGDAAALVVWVQRCWMRPCTSLQSHFVSVVMIQRGKDPSWWDRQTTQGPHSKMGRLVCCQRWC